MNALWILIKRKHEPVSASKSVHVVHVRKALGVAEDLLDGCKCVQDFRDWSRLWTIEGIGILRPQPRQGLLHLLRSEKREARIDGVLQNGNTSA